MTLSQITYFFILCFLLFAGLGTPKPVNGSQEQATTKLFSIEATDEKLKDVLARLADNSGYEIVVSPQWQDLLISVQCSNVTLEQALVTILGKKHNHAIVWKESKKHISIIISKISSTRTAPDGSGSVQSNEAKNRPSVQMVPSVSLSGNDRRFQQASQTTINTLPVDRSFSY